MRFFGKKPKETHETVLHEVPMSTVFRWYLYDTELSEDTNELAELVGLSRVSAEGDEKEQEDSERRVKEVAPMFNFLDAISEFSARSLVAIHMTELIDEDEDVEDSVLEAKAEASYAIYKAVALSTLMGAFSIGIELGMIEPNVIGSNIIDFEGYEDDE